MSSAPDAREQILQCLDKGQDLLLDLSAVRYIDSSGVAVLVEGHLTARKKELHFGLLAPSRAVIDVLRLARMEDILPIHASIESLTS
jgi:anti-sigma B factor antagonist